MNYQMAMTRNVSKFIQSVDELMNRDRGPEGLGVVWGDPGTGKSTAVEYAAVEMDGIFVRARSTWTLTAMLAKICHELSLQRRRNADEMIDLIVTELSARKRPIFIDEADYLFRHMETFECLRDIYDLSKCPVIFIGMEDFARKMRGNGQVSRRVGSWIEFVGLDFADTRTVAETVCEVKIADDLLAHLHNETLGNVGRIVMGLARIEKLAKDADIETMDLDEWAGRELFFDQPTFTVRKR